MLGILQTFEGFHVVCQLVKICIEKTRCLDYNIDITLQGGLYTQNGVSIVLFQDLI